MPETTGTRAQYQRAIDKAEARGGVRRVRFIGRGDYRVDGDSARYVVHVSREGTYACTCAAGQRQQPCWHQASVWLKRKGLEACGRHTSGTLTLSGAAR